MPEVSRLMMPDKCEISPTEYATYPKQKMSKVSLIDETEINLIDLRM